MVVSTDYQILQRASATSVRNVGHMKAYAFVIINDFVRDFPRPVKEEDITRAEWPHCVREQLLTGSDKTPLAWILTDNLIKDATAPRLATDYNICMRYPFIMHRFYFAHSV